MVMWVSDAWRTLAWDDWRRMVHLLPHDVVAIREASGVLEEGHPG